MDKNYQVINLKEKVAADYQIKAAFLGNSGVGKTSIIKYEIENQVPVGVQPTSIFQYFSKDCLICDKIIHLQIWDMGGDSTYEKLLTNFYSASLCIFVVFALDDKDSFEDLDLPLSKFTSLARPGTNLHSSSAFSLTIPVACSLPPVVTNK